jgi:hypothetical protein
VSGRSTALISPFAHTPSHSFGHSSSDSAQWNYCAVGKWPGSNEQYSYVLLPETEKHFYEICSAWPALAHCNKPDYTAYCIVCPARVTAAATAWAAVAPVAAMPVVLQQQQVRRDRRGAFHAHRAAAAAAAAVAGSTTTAAVASESPVVAVAATVPAAATAAAPVAVAASAAPAAAAPAAVVAPAVTPATTAQADAVSDTLQTTATGTAGVRTETAVRSASADLSASSTKPTATKATVSVSRAVFLQLLTVYSGRAATSVTPQTLQWHSAVRGCLYRPATTQ